MKVMFFVQPFIEEGYPLLRKHPLEFFSVRFIAAIQSSSLAGDFEFCVVTGETLAGHYDVADVKKVVLPETDLLSPFPSHSYGQALAHMAGIQSNPALLGYFSQLIHMHVGDFVPDLIFCSGHFPYLRHAYPTTLILHQEYSVFSRIPYPVTAYMDPFGLMAGGNFFDRYTDDIRKIVPPKNEIEALEKMKQACRECIRSTNPFKEVMAPFEKQFEKMVLLPLRGGDSGALMDQVATMLKLVPSDVGLIVTNHPDRSLLKFQGMYQLKESYPNLIWDEAFEDYHGQSQYLIQYADTLVIEGSTSVVYQSLIWDTKLLSLSGVHANLSDAQYPEKLLETLDKRKEVSPQKQQLLHWLLTHYAILSDYYYDGEWLGRFIQRCHDQWQHHGISAQFYAQIDDPKIIFKKVADALDKFPPQKTTRVSYSFDRLQKQCAIYEEQINQYAAVTRRISSGTAALEKLLEAIFNNPTSADLCVKAGDTCVGFGLFGNAKSFFQQALHLDPNNTRARIGLKKLG